MYPVDLHVHTIASTHAYSTVADYVEMAKRNGIEMFALTNHGPDMADAPHRYHFQNLSVIPRLIDGVGILYGIEANIKNVQGETDCYPEIDCCLDFVVAGFHESVMQPQSKDVNTQALIATIASGKVHMISHPGNPKYPIDIPAVARAAAQYHVALEINNSSFIHSRPGSASNCIEIAKAVKQAGGWIGLGSDSHFAHSLGGFDKALEALTQIDFPQARILNVSARRVLDFLAARGRPPIAEFAHF